MRTFGNEYQTGSRKMLMALLLVIMGASEACSNQAKPITGAAQSIRTATTPPVVTPLRLGVVTSPIATQANLPQADPNFPEAQYVRLDSGYQVAELFYALSGMPPNYESLATAASQDFRSSNDEFRKRDILQALMPKINEQIAAYKNTQARYFTMQVARGSLLGHYDFSSASFPFQQGLAVDSYRMIAYPDASFNRTNLVRIAVAAA